MTRSAALVLRQLGSAFLDLDQPLQSLHRLGALDPERIAFDRVVAKYFDRPTHHPDLVGSAIIDNDVEASGGDRGHSRAEPGQAGNDVSTDIEPHDQRRTDQAQNRNGGENDAGLALRRKGAYGRWRPSDAWR